MENSTNLADFLNSKYTIKERKRLLTRHRSKIGIYFRPRTKKKGGYKEDVQWVYVRISVNGVKAKSDMSTGISLVSGTWDIATKRIKGHSAKIDEKNRALSQIENDILTLYNDLRQQGVVPTAEMIKDVYSKSRFKSIEHLGLIGYYQSFLDHHQYTIAKATLNSYKSRLNTLKTYLKATKQQNVTIDGINPKWAMVYHKHFIERKNGFDHVRRAVQTISKVLDFAVINEDLENNPLKSLRLPRSCQKPIKYLTISEIEQLKTCPYFDNRLQKVVDCFLLQCYTGMAYNELFMFDAEKHLKTESDGQEWIIIRRGKTGALSTIPVIEHAKAILQKYDYKLPVITNQKLNDFIKEAAQIAGLKNANEITTHVARKTAGTFFLNHGLPLETVSKVLGHKSVKITQAHYAELLTSTIKNNFKKFGLI